jgi:glutathione synthase/RimK-type ligase-like ATP-grasp enzyme
MSSYVIIVERLTDLDLKRADITVVTTRDFIARPDRLGRGPARVINLSHSKSYLGAGYYGSLLAEAKGHRVMPSVQTIVDLSRKSTYLFRLPELNALLRQCLRRLTSPPEASFSLTVFFGQTEDHRFRDLARRSFDLFRAPILSLDLRFKKDWSVARLKLLSLNDIEPDRQPAFFQALDLHARSGWREPPSRSASRYSLAILHNPKEAMAPSDAGTLKKFIKAGEKLGIAIDLIEHKDYRRLAEYDALFIRETTALDHPSYRFSKKAEIEGMPVIDDPTSILRCTNKVYLAELLRVNQILAPRTVIADRSRIATLDRDIPFPIVLKVPDGCFSRGVFKVQNRDELQIMAARLFKGSNLILAQEYLYTSFDWRVGVLNRKPLFVCQYGMADKHWQILKYDRDGRIHYGGFEVLPVEEAPALVIETAVRAAELIGDGLYGVDLKQTDEGVHVLEINDNPNIETGVEDGCLKDELYHIILREFLRRIENRRMPLHPVPASAAPRGPARPIPIAREISRKSGG